MEMLELSVSPYLPAAPVPVELVQLRKLLALQASGMKLAGGEVSAGLLTSFVLMALLCGAGAVGICVLGWLLFRRRNGVPALVFSEQDVQVLLNSLSDNNVIGSSGTGDRLYRVPLQHMTVTVKKLENEIGTVDADLDSRCQSEVNMLGVIRHKSIINVVHCIRRDNMILLLYEHMENGSLDEWLPNQSVGAGGRRRPPLGWPARRAIATGVARGLCYMHHECNRPIVHRNIRPSNILLDGDLKAKIAGFDLARINPAGLNQPLPNSELPADSFGYTAPEYAYMPDEVNEKVDVYSFGVVLLELITGRMANGPGVEGHLATWAHNHHRELIAGERHGTFRNVVDMDIPDGARHLKEMAAVFMLAVECTVKDPRERPSMQTVLKRLRRCGCLRGLGPCVSFL